MLSESTANEIYTEPSIPDLATDLLQHRGGLNSNCLSTILQSPDDLDSAISISSTSPYIDASNAVTHLKCHKNSFTVLTLNIQSLHAKFDRLNDFINELSAENVFFSAICLQETWLSGRDVDTTTLNLPNYQSIALGASVSKHGGLIIYLHESFRYKILDMYTASNIWEGMFLEISGQNLKQNIILGNIYRPPRDKNEDINNFIEEYCRILAKIHGKRRDVILAGDFNIDLLQVKNRNAFGEYLDQMFSFGFSPILTLPTRFSKHKATLIDHIFCKSSDQMNRCRGGIILKALSDHYPAFVALKGKLTQKRPPKRITISNTSPQAFERYKAEISSQNFSSILDENINHDPTPNLEIINSVLVTAKNKFLAPKTVTFRRYKHKVNPWMTHGILNSIKSRDILYKKLHRLNPNTLEFSSTDTNLKTFNRILNKAIRQAKSSYYNCLFAKYKSDTKKTWETLHSVMNITKNKQNFPNFFRVNNTTISHKEEIAQNFNQFFVNIGPALASKIKYVNDNEFKKYLFNPIQRQFTFQIVNENDIANVFRELTSKSSTDINGLSIKMLKLVSTKLCFPLCVIVNQSLNTGIFPQSLKIAKVIPVFKKDDNTNLTNYRPISLLPVLSKIFEKIVHTQLSAYFVEHKLLFKSQHGFRKNHSTETATLEFIDKLLKHLDKNTTPLSIFLDLSKAFDTLDHNILLEKLSFYGVRNSSLTWFKSYLADRYQCVDYLNHISSQLPIKTGVPQGSILGPLLFIIYMNDISFSSSIFDFILYADDTTLTCTEESLTAHVTKNNDLNVILNNELNKVHRWLLANKLSVNIKKTKFMVFHLPRKDVISAPFNLKIENINLERVFEFDFLGTVLSDTLSWKQHINKICIKLARTIGILKRVKTFLPQVALMVLYNSLFMSTINYSSLVWALTKQERIVKLQKKAIRVLCLSKYNAHTEPLFKKLDYLKFSDIVQLRSLQFYYKSVHHLLPDYFDNIFTSDTPDHCYNTRNKSKSRPQVSKKVSTSRCIRFFIPNIVNDTPSPVINKINTHSLGGFTNYAKYSFLSSYKDVCETPNCYICQNTSNLLD